MIPIWNSIRTLSGSGAYNEDFKRHLKKHPKKHFKKYFTRFLKYDLKDGTITVVLSHGAFQEPSNQISNTCKKHCMINYKE